MSKPLDPALLRQVRSARGAVLVTAALVIAQTALVVLGAVLLARALAPLVTGDAVWADVAAGVGAFALTMLGRAVLAAATHLRAHRAATRVIAELRQRLLRHVAALGPRWLASHGSELSTIATRGLDALEPYLVKYLPQLLQTAILTPAIGVVIATQDTLSALTLLIALPLIPVFMWLIGVATASATERRLDAQQRLDAGLLDLVAGLPTLRALGRARGTVPRVRDLADAERGGTMATLRIAFLSGAVLELLASITVALVAVGVGLRLVEGDLRLVVGLTVLILAPEVLLPLRMVGTHFHAAADGVTAVERALAVLAEPVPAHGCGHIGRVTQARWDGVDVLAPGRDEPTPSGLTGAVRLAEVTVLRGRSGSGKTSAALALMGLLAPDAGTIWLRTQDGADATEHDLADLDRADWHHQLTWVPQHPVLEPGTVAELVGGADARTRARAAAVTGLDHVIDTLPQGWQTPLGGNARGLSAGQRQRLALTRALVARTGFVILDEPTAHLDSASAHQVAQLVRSLADDGRGVLVLTHEDAVAAVADTVLVTGERVRA